MGGLESIYFIISFVFLVLGIFMVTSSFELRSKIGAIIFCILGIFIYAFLGAGICLSLKPLEVAFTIICFAFLASAIFLLIQGTTFLKKWQAMVICCAGFLYYLILLGAYAISDKL